MNKIIPCLLSLIFLSAAVCYSSDVLYQADLNDPGSIVSLMKDRDGNNPGEDIIEEKVIKIRHKYLIYEFGEADLTDYTLKLVMTRVTSDQEGEGYLCIKPRSTAHDKYYQAWLRDIGYYLGFCDAENGSGFYEHKHTTGKVAYNTKTTIEVQVKDFSITLFQDGMKISSWIDEKKRHPAGYVSLFFANFLCDIEEVSIIPATGVSTYKKSALQQDKWLVDILKKTPHTMDRGFYSKNRIAHMEHNVKNYDWAKKQKNEIITRADSWLKYDDETLRHLVVPPQVPRAFAVQFPDSSPVENEKLLPGESRTWKISFDNPYKIVHPRTGSVYPANDFFSYVKSGFKDKEFLKSSKSPYTDDGFGYEKKGEKYKYWFVGYYAEWSVQLMLLPALRDLSRAFLLTGDERYAHACTVLLWQLAEYYPDYDYKSQSRYGLEYIPDYEGRLLYHTWEAQNTAKAVPEAYDAIRPSIKNNKKLKKLTSYDPETVQKRIEERLLLTMANDMVYFNGKIGGNFGMAQGALIRIAASLKYRETQPTQFEMLRWILANPVPPTAASMGIEDALINQVYRDGYAFEAPSYSFYWIVDINAVVTELDNYNPEIAKRLINTSRYNKLFKWPLSMLCLGKISPPLGDSDTMFPGNIAYLEDYLEYGYRYYNEPVFAKALVTRNTGLSENLFEKNLNFEMLKKEALRYPEEIGKTSSLLPGLGHLTLQSKGNTPLAISLFYGFFKQHGERDRLHFDLYSHDWSMLPDFGYPETAEVHDPRRCAFFGNTIGHNTVIVNEKAQNISRGRLHTYDPGNFVQLARVSAEDAYPDIVSLYHRELVLVEASPDHTYLVDIFRVRGGNQHDWGVHGTQAEFSSGLPFSAPRKNGTLAGPNVNLAEYYDDDRFKDNNKAQIPNYFYEGSGFQHLINVQEAAFSGSGDATWSLSRPETIRPKLATKGIALKAHLLGGKETVFACDGIPQRRPTWPETVKFLIRRRTGAGLESVYITVFEPHKNTTFIKSLNALPISNPGDDLPVAFTVTTADSVITHFHRLPGPSKKPTIFRSGGKEYDKTAVVNAQSSQSVLQKEYLLDKPLTARITGIDYETGIVQLDTPILQKGNIAGGQAIIESPGHANTVTVSKILSASSFKIENDDLTAGRVYLVKIENGSELLITPMSAEYIENGMTVINEKNQRMGRIIAGPKMQIWVVNATSFTIDMKAKLEDFPDIDGDGRRAFRAMILGTGDTVTVYYSSRK